MIVLGVYPKATLVPALSPYLFSDLLVWIAHTPSPFTHNCDFSLKALSAPVYTSFHDEFESPLWGKVMKEEDVAEMPKKYF